MEEKDKRRLVIDPSKCIMCGACTAVAPNNCMWAPGSDTPKVVDETPTKEAEEAVGNCPTGAVHFVEVDIDKK